MKVEALILEQAIDASYTILSFTQIKSNNHVAQFYAVMNTNCDCNIQS